MGLQTGVWRVFWLPWVDLHPPAAAIPPQRGCTAGTVHEVIEQSSLQSRAGGPYGGRLHRSIVLIWIVLWCAVLSQALDQKSRNWFGDKDSS